MDHRLPLFFPGIKQVTLLRVRVPSGSEGSVCRKAFRVVLKIRKPGPGKDRQRE